LQDEELCLIAVSADGEVLEYISEEKQTEKVCMAAIKNNPTSIQYVKKLTPELCIYAVSLNKKAMEYIELNDLFDYKI